MKNSVAVGPKELDFIVPTEVVTRKPSGFTSKTLKEGSPGTHAPYNPQYHRKVRTAYPTQDFRDELIRRLNRLVESKPAHRMVDPKRVGNSLIVNLVLEVLNDILGPGHEIRSVYQVKEGPLDELLGFEALPKPKG